MKKGFFISFEGLDGCGKSTQIALLANYLSDKGFEVKTTFEPGATELGVVIRELLLRPEYVAKKLHLDYESISVDKFSEALLYAADRAQHVKEVIVPALQRGDIVISDRYVDSSIVYQGYVRGLGTKFVELINEKATKESYPDLTFFLDVPVIKMQYRLAKREMDRIEREKMHFHESVRQAYLKIATENPQRFVVINSDRPKKRVFNEIVRNVERKLETEN